MHQLGTRIPLSRRQQGQCPVAGGDGCRQVAAHAFEQGPLLVGCALHEWRQRGLRQNLGDQCNGLLAVLSADRRCTPDLHLGDGRRIASATCRAVGEGQGFGLAVAVGAAKAQASDLQVQRRLLAGNPRAANRLAGVGQRFLDCSQVLGLLRSLRPPRRRLAILAALLPVPGDLGRVGVGLGERARQRAVQQTTPLGRQRIDERLPDQVVGEAIAAGIVDNHQVCGAHTFERGHALPLAERRGARDQLEAHRPAQAARRLEQTARRFAQALDACQDGVAHAGRAPAVRRSPWSDRPRACATGPAASTRIHPVSSRWRRVSSRNRGGRRWRGAADRRSARRWPSPTGGAPGSACRRARDASAPACGRCRC